MPQQLPDETNGYFGLRFAGLVMAMLPTLIVYLILQERLTRGITVGGLKA